MDHNRFNLEAARRYAGAMEQLADARMSELSEGNGRGNRIIRVTNGGGIDFTITPDRGMDIVECSFRGIPMAFRSPVGHAAAARYEPAGKGWLRNWPAGLMTTAGLRNVAVPNGEFGLHGRASNLSAEDVGIRRFEADGEYRIEAVGTLRESMMFGEYLELRRTISTAWGVNTIRLHDEVTNRNALPDYLQILYHCNFGWPLVSPALEFEAPDHPVTPRNARAAEGLAEWNRLPEPTVDFTEQCYFHQLPAGADGMARMSIVNREIGVRATIAYATAELPRLVQWKNCRTGLYVLGLEPTNAGLAGRTEDIAAGRARQILPGETICFDLAITFEQL